MPYIDLAGLSRYASRQKERLERDYALLRDMQWTRSEKAGAVSLWPAPSTPLEPVVDFLFTETGPASGDKGPENPSTITGVSSVKVTRCGKNLVSPNLKPQGSQYDIGDNVRGIVTTRTEDRRLVLNGTADSNGYYNYIPINHLPQGMTYSFSGFPGGGNQTWFAQIFNTGSTTRDFGSGVTYTQSFPQSSEQLMTVRITPNSAVSNLIWSVQLELGSEITEYEEPVSDTYTISLNGTYYGGILDVATGVMTVTHGVLILDGTELWSTPTQVAEGIYRHGFTRQNGTLYSLGSDGGSSCTHFNYIYSANAPQISYYLGSYSAQRLMYVNMKTSYATSDVQKAWLASEYSAGHPVAITGLLYAPFTVQLDPVSISALAQADKYTPRLNTVYTDAQAVQVGYVKSPIRDEYELQQAVIAQGGNV